MADILGVMWLHTVAMVEPLEYDERRVQLVCRLIEDKGNPA
jgi:hypothetical protein